MYINRQGHMTKMAAMSIYGKNLKKPPSPEPEVLYLETWHVAVGSQSLQSLYK